MEEYSLTEKNLAMDELNILGFVRGWIFNSLQLYREPPWANSIIRQTGRTVLAP
jgi:hypothetical protein